MNKLLNISVYHYAQINYQNDKHILSKLSCLGKGVVIYMITRVTNGPKTTFCNGLKHTGVYEVTLHWSPKAR
jgi:hypothetical protein